MTKISLCLIAWLMPLSIASADHIVWKQQDQLVALDGEAGNRFGGNPTAIAIDGDTVLIGALSANSAYVFVRRGGVWSEQARLSPPEGEAWGQFGWSVALSGDTALVGANIADDWHGEVYVFTRTGEEWTETAKLSASEGGAFHTFGNAVALSGDTAMVGAAGGLSALPGSVYVFTRSGDEWTEQAKLTASDGTGGDHFGSAVAVRNDVAVIGARAAEIDGSSEQGAAYVFGWNGETWIEQVKLTASDGAAEQRFGHTVALGGDGVLVGAPSVPANNIQGGAGGENSGPGAAYVFSLSDGKWSEQSRLATPHAGVGGFGYALGMSGDVAVVGAPMTDKNGNLGQGVAYIFNRSGEQWNGPFELLSPDASAEEWSGFSVGIHGDTVMVGVPGKIFAGMSDIEGSVRVFGPAADAVFSDRFEQ